MLSIELNVALPCAGCADIWVSCIDVVYPLHRASNLKLATCRMALRDHGSRNGATHRCLGQTIGSPTGATWQVLVNVVCFPQTTPPTVPRAHKKSFPGGAPPPQTPPNGRPLSRPPQARRAPRSSLWSAAVAASEGQCLGSCPRSAKISMSSQDDLGQGPACSALAMDPKQMEVRGLRPLASNG